MKKYWLLLFLLLIGVMKNEAEPVKIGDLYYYLSGSTASVSQVPTGELKYKGDITIPSTIQYDDVTYDVTEIYMSAFDRCTDLTSVYISEGITRIDYAAFYGCSNLNSVYIPQTVKTLGRDAFYGCTQLKSVNISNLSAWCQIDFISLYSNPLSLAHKLYLNGSLVEDITIPDDILYIPAYIFAGCSSLKSVTIPNSVTSIRGWSFQDCVNISSIIIPNSVTTIGDYAFANCSKISTISIPNSVTDIGVYVFSNCAELTSISISTELKLIEASTFLNCKKLSSVQIPNSVTSIGSSAFSGCYNLQSIQIPNSVTSIGSSAFSGCYNIQSVQIPNSVTTIGDYSFSNCSNLLEVTIPSSITQIGNSAFSSCGKLTAVNISDISSWCKIEFANSASNPLTIAHNLYLNGSLVENVIIPEGISYLPAYAFNSCRPLKSVTIPNSLSKIGAFAFDDCNKLESVRITDLSAWCNMVFEKTPQSNPLQYAHNLYLNGEKITDLVIPDGVSAINDYAFYGIDCSSITIPQTVTSIGEEAFLCFYSQDGSYSIKEVHVNRRTPIPFSNSFPYSFYYSDYDDIAYIDMKLYIPAGCYDAYSKDDRWKKFSSIKEDVPEIIEEAPFTYQPQKPTGGLILKSIDKTYTGATTIPHYYNYNGYQWPISKIGDAAFLSHKGVTSITFNSSIASIGTNALSDMTALSSINVPDDNNSYKSVDGVLFTKGDELVQYPIAKATTSYSVPEQTVSIGRDAFYKSKLTSIDLPSTLTKIGYDAFGYCTNISSFTLPSGLVSIGDYAFDHCTKLNTINIPNKVRSIGDYAFNSCVELASIECYCYPFAIPENTFPDIVFENAVLHVPSNSITVFKKIQGWKRFKNIVGDLEGGNTTIIFADQDVRNICISNWDTNGDRALDYNEAAAVTSLGSLFQGNNTITSFNELGFFTGLTQIDNYAFKACKNLKSVIIPGNVTQIGTSAFYSCYALTKIYLPEGLQVINDYGIAACIHLKRVELPSSLTTIKTKAFYYNQELDSINIPASVTTIGASAFAACNNLLDVTANMPNPCAIGSNVFSNYSKATLHVPYGKLNTYKNTAYWSSFINIEEMEDDGSGQSDIPEEFEISSVTYRVVDNQKVTVKSVDKSYSGSLVLLPEVAAHGISNWQVIGIDEQAMLFCKGITSLTIPATVKTIGDNALSGMSSLEQIIVATDNPYFVSVEGVLFTKDGEKLVQFPIEKAKQYDVPSGTTTIDKDAFYQSNLTSIVLPPTLINVNYDAFGYCKNLKEITIPESVKTIGEYSFGHCTSLTSVHLPSITAIPNYAFNYCTALSSILLPSSLLTIGENAFKECIALEKVSCKMTEPASLPDNAFPASVYENAVLQVPQNTLPLYQKASGWKNFKNIVEDETITFADANVKAICVTNWDTNGDSELDKNEAAAVSSLGSTFTGNTTITTFNELKYFTGLTKIDENAFKNCRTLQSVIVPANVKQIGKSAFYGDYALTNIVLPEGLEIINDYGIGACTKLADIILPSTLTTIKTRAFYYDKLLVSINLPASVTSIGTYAFASCPVLLDVTANMMAPCTIAENVFPENTYSKGTLTVPYGTYDKYKTTNYWSKFVNIKSLAGQVSISAAPISIVAGESGDLVLRLEQNLPSVSFQFDLTLAYGITLQNATVIPSSDFAVSTAKVGTNKWRILAYSPTNKPLSANVGDLMTLNIQTEELLSAGTRTVTISDFTLTNLGANNYLSYISLDGITSSVTVTAAPVTNAGKGDVNLDGTVNVQDIVVLINHIFGSTPAKFSTANADANGDGIVNVVDVSTIVLLCMPATSSNPAPAHAPAASLASMTWDTTNGLALSIDDATSYVAAQMDVTVDGTLQVNNITAVNGHTPVWQQIGENRYRVLVFSSANDTFSAFGPHLFFDVLGEGEITLSNALLVDAAGEGFNAAASSTGITTGISTITTELSAPADVYSVSGQLVRHQASSLKGLPTGTYIVNGRKLMVK